MLSDHLVFLENETALFKHSSTHNKTQGELYVTNLRIVWLPNNSQKETISVSSSEILKDQYSPATESKSMLKLTKVSKDPALIFILEGSDASVTRKELEKLKEAIKQLKSNGNFVSKPQEDVVGKVSNKRSRTQMAVDNSAEKLRRQSILNSDRELRKKYIELVSDGKVIEEEDFWNSHQHLLAQKEAQDISSTKGILSNLFSGYI